MSDLVVNPEDRYSHNEAQLRLSTVDWVDAKADVSLHLVQSPQVLDLSCINSFHFV